MPPEQMERWAAIVGYGCVSALGHGSADFRKALFSGTSGIGPLVLSSGGDRLKIPLAAQVRHWDPAQWFPAEKRSFLDLFSQYALVAALEAVQMSGIDPEHLRGSRTAVIIATGIGGVITQSEVCRSFYGEKSRRGDPLAIPKVMSSAAASHVSMRFGITGPVFAVSSACASSNHAIAVGLGLLRAGMVDRVLVGGSEASVVDVCLRSWELMRVLSPKECAPFSQGRLGMVIGEGAGVLVLERPERAYARKAKTLGWLCGVGMSSDAGDLLRPDPSGAALAVTQALNDAERMPEEIGYINAHGTGTLVNDHVETQVVHRVFGAHAHALAISSTKAMHGHALGAAGALECIATVMALEEGILPPTLNWKPGDPGCDLDYVPNVPREKKVTWALSHSFAFGGLNAVLCLRAP